MIRSFTIEGAKANYLDKQTGTIKVGKRADLVVLDTNLLKVADPTELFNAHVLYTMGSGQVAVRHALRRPAPAPGRRAVDRMTRRGGAPSAPRPFSRGLCRARAGARAPAS